MQYFKYFGEFRSLENRHYKVYFNYLENGAWFYHEINLAGESPFVVSYGEVKPFDGIRTSTASISVVYDEYMTELFDRLATGTEVKLVEVDDSTSAETICWVGYLQNNLQNQSYENCTEVITLEASDCIARSQYFTYKPISGTKEIVSLKDILWHFMDYFVSLDKLIVVDSKTINGESLDIEKIQISECNFFTSDTDRGWTYQEVLEEFCKYLGYTAIQWGSSLYLIDYSMYSREIADCDAFEYTKTETGFSDPTIIRVGGVKVIQEQDYMGSGNQLSFETIYNKCKVNCNYYEADLMVPDIFDDANLTNIYGSKNEARYIFKNPNRMNYINNQHQLKAEEVDTNVYVRKSFKNKYYDEVWHKNGGITQLTEEEAKNNVAFYISSWGENTGSDLMTRYGWDITFGGQIDSGSWQEWTNGLDIFNVQWNGLNGTTTDTIFSITYDNVNISPELNTWAEYYDEYHQLLFWYYIDTQRYQVGFIPNSDRWYVGASYYPMFYWYNSPVINYGNVYKIVPTGGVIGAWANVALLNSAYDKERRFKINFYYGTESNNYSATTYMTVAAHTDAAIDLTVFCLDPVLASDEYVVFNVVVSDAANSRYQNGVSWYRSTSPAFLYPLDTSLEKNFAGSRIVDLADFDENTEQIPSSLSYSRYLMLAQNGAPQDEAGGTYDASKHRELLKLSSDYAPAVFINNAAFFYINADATFERHWNADYINSNWATDKSMVYQNDGGIYNQDPALVFKLGVGDKWWNGSSWQLGECSFKVEMYDDTANAEEDNQKHCWNKSMPIKNKVYWTEYSGGEGYRINIPDDLDMNGKIYFAICMPVLMQKGTGSGQTQTVLTNFNGYTWLSNLKFGLATRNDEKYDLSDLVYENVIDEDSVNELNDINLKITSYPEKGKLSYSHCGYDGTFLKGIRDLANYESGEQLPEYNIIEKNVFEYSTPTKKLNLVLNMDYNPFIMVQDEYWGEDRFVITGQEISYQKDSNQVDLTEIKFNKRHIQDNILTVRFYYWPSEEEVVEIPIPTTASTEWGANYLYSETVYEGGSTRPGSPQYYSTTYVFDGPVKRIPANAFNANTAPYSAVSTQEIYSIYLPKYVEQIGENAIANLPELYEIISDITSTGNTLSTGALSNNSTADWITEEDTLLTIPANVDYQGWKNRLGEKWGGATPVSITLAENTHSTDSLEETFNVSFSYNGNFNVSAVSNQDWVSATVVGKIATIRIGNNDGVNSRTANITFNAEDVLQQPAILTISQAARTLRLYADKANMTASSTGYSTSTAKIYYDGNTSDLTITSAANWIHLNGPSNLAWYNVGGDIYLKSAELQFNCDRLTSAERTGTVVVSNGNITLNISLKQSGAVIIDRVMVMYEGSEAQSYSDGYTDYLIPSGLSNDDVIFVPLKTVNREDTSKEPTQLVMYPSRNEDRTGWYFSNRIVDGTVYLSKGATPDSQGYTWYYLARNSYLNPQGGPYDYSVFENQGFNIAKFFENAPQGTTPFGGMTLPYRQLKFELNSGEVLLKKHYVNGSWDGTYEEPVIKIWLMQ